MKEWDSLKNRKQGIIDHFKRLNGEFDRLQLERKALDKRFESFNSEIRKLSEELNEIYIEMDTISTEELIKRGL
jgi:uncharacterized coiled-coil DUF342 family protein